MSILSQEFIFAALDAEKAGEQFPISLNDEKVWQALGYSQFRYAVQRLETFQSFKYEVDYVCIPVTTNQDTYLLSVDCFKMLAMVSDDAVLATAVVEISNKYLFTSNLSKSIILKDRVLEK